jgi:adenylate cyclase
MANTRRLASILVADVVGYTGLMERAEDDTHKRVSALISQIIPRLLSRHKGRLIKTTGDGLLGTFPNVLDAVRCAVRLQKDLVRHARIRRSPSIKLRVGINVGDIIFERDDVYGECVNTAVRITTLAEPDGICLSRAVYDQVRRKIPLKFESLGRPALKNISDPPEIFRLRIDNEIANPLPLPSIAAGDLYLRRPIVEINALYSLREDFQAGAIAESFARELCARMQNCGFFHIRSNLFAPQRILKDYPAFGGGPASYSVDGHVLRFGNTARLVVQLSDAISGFQLWAGFFNLRLSNLLSSQEAAVFGAAARIEADVQRQEFERNARGALCQEDVYGRTQRAYWLYYRRERDGNQAALTDFTELVDSDSRNVPALAGAAACHFWAGQQLWASDSVRSLHLANELAERAVRADPELPWARLIFAQSQLFLGRHESAVAEARVAAELNPTNPAIRAFLGHALTAAGNSSGAISHLRKAFAIAPFHRNRFMWLSNLALARYHMHRFEEASAAAAEAAKLSPDHWLANQVHVASLVRLGQIDEAKVLVDQIQTRERQTGHDKLTNRLPYRNDGDLQFVVKALGQAGWEGRG